MLFKTKENCLMLVTIVMVMVTVLIAGWNQSYDLISRVPLIFDVPYLIDAIPTVSAIHFPEN